jgi:hypothetical protein
MPQAGAFGGTIMSDLPARAADESPSRAWAPALLRRGSGETTVDFVTIETRLSPIEMGDIDAPSG